MSRHLERFTSILTVATCLFVLGVMSYRMFRPTRTIIGYSNGEVVEATLMDLVNKYSQPSVLI